MSLIEQAAKRLEQLRQAGVELPDEPDKRTTGSSEFTISQPAPPIPTEYLNSPRTQNPTTSGFVSAQTILDQEAISASGLLTPNAARSQLADEFRVVKRPLKICESRVQPRKMELH